MKTIIKIWTLALVFALPMMSQAQTKSTLLYNGSAANKFDVVFIGDGFTSADQADYNTMVDDYYKAIFTHDNGGLDDVLSEIQDALNVYRVNINSVNSGVTQYTCATDGCPPKSDNKNTALKFRYSGCWDCCWMNWNGDSETRINNALSTVGLSGADYVVVIINESGGGGCSGGRILSITKSTSNRVLLHELGHSIGKLSDEYDRDGCYSGGEPSRRNASKNTNTSKWSLFDRNPVTTGNPIEYNVDAFEGAVYKDECVYRPSSNSTMRGNTNLFNPPSYDEFWQQNKGRSDYNFSKVITGDFGGNSYADVVLHYGKYLASYPVGSPPGFTGSGTSTRVTNSVMTSKTIKGSGGTWYVNANDQYHVGDFTGDGKDDLLAFYPNGQYSRLGILKSVNGKFECIRKIYYNLPSFSMRSGDKFFIADFNGDGKDDFYIYNITDWNQGYLGMYASTGSNFNYVRRYDKYIPGNFMSSSDKYFVADINGDNKEEFVVYKSATQTTRVYTTNGNSLTLSSEYFQNLPGWASKANDEYHIADFNGDGKDDLYVFNGKDWGPEYMLMLRSNGTGYSYVRRYDDALPGWNMNNNDQHYVADFNGDGKEDLFVYNSADWSTQFLGKIKSASTSLSVTHQSDWIGGWNLGSVDQLKVADRNTGSDQLFIHNTNWFGYLIPSGNNMYLRTMYKDYIHTFKHHDYGWY